MRIHSYTERLLAGIYAEGEAAAGAGGGDKGAAGAAGDGAAAAAAAAAAADAAKPFADSLPEDIRTDMAFKDIKDLPGLAKSYLNAARLVGLDKGSIIAVPKPDADAKTWDDFYAKAGRPETADKYDVPKRADGKAYGDADVALQKQILPVLHQAGLTQRQIAAIVPKWNEIVGGMTTAQTEAEATARTTAGNALKTEWGAAHQERLTLAQDAIKHYAGELKLGDQIVSELEATKLGNLPGLAKLFSHLGAQLKEDGLLGKGGDGGAAALSPTEAKQQIAAMGADKEKFAAMRDAKHPKHAELVAEWTRLHELAYPAAAAA